MSNKKAMAKPGNGKAERETEGFFQISWSRLKEIARHPDLGHDAVLVYTAAAAGVDSSCKEPRSSTHGMPAFRSRTTMGSGEISSAIDSLTERKFFEKPSTAVAVTTLAETQSVDGVGVTPVTGTGKEQFPTQVRVDPDEPCDLALSTQFLEKAVPLNEATNHYRGKFGSLLSLSEKIQTVK